MSRGFWQSLTGDHARGFHPVPGDTEISALLDVQSVPKIDSIVVQDGASSLDTAEDSNGSRETDRAAPLHAPADARLTIGTKQDELITSLGGDDTVFSGDGKDTVWAGEGNDNVAGDNGDDQVFGEQGNDNIGGGDGNDMLYGGHGDDLFGFVAGSGSDRIVGFNAAEGDRLDLEGQTYLRGVTSDGSAALALSGGGTIRLEGVTTIDDGFFA